MMSDEKQFKITTSWTGFSEITIKAKNEDEAREKYFEGDYTATTPKFFLDHREFLANSCCFLDEEVTS